MHSSELFFKGVKRMIFEDYTQILKGFQHDESVSLTSTFDELCAAQDTLIAEIVEKGANIAGWKIVDKDGVLILSPIFDFQVFSNQGEQISNQAIRGTELEICFSLKVPNQLEEVDSVLAELAPFVAVELIRPEIHPNNHSACDFYFNYGVFVSEQPVSGDVVFEGGKLGYRFFAQIDQLVEEKKAIVKRGILQCIQRGYGNKPYFFITGTLNGLVPAADSLGVNRVVCQEKAIIQFDLV